MHVPLLRGDMPGSASSLLAPATPGRWWHMCDVLLASSASRSPHSPVTLGKVRVWWSDEREFEHLWDADPTEIPVGPFV